MIPPLRLAWIRRSFGFALLLACSLPFAAAAETGSISGVVSNSATGNLLEGARVEIPALHLETLTDNTGRYVLPALPAGAHELVVSYTGLDSARATIAAATGQIATRNFDLSSGIYKLDVFKVAGEREGGAAAITAQRNADNRKDIAAADSFGNLPNLNAGEVAIRLPGVYGELDGGGNLSGFTVRGMTAGSNSVTMDGAMLTGQPGAGRSIFPNIFSATMFDEIEVIKGHTPDKGAESLGGTINFKSRSPLSLKEKRRVTYTLSSRIAPSFTQQIPLREARRTHGLATLNYQEVFDAFGGERNLGVSLTLFNSETALGWFTSTRDIQNVSSGPAYVWDYRTGDVFNHRRQKTMNLKADYRLTTATKLSFLAAYIDHSEVFRRQYDTRAYTGTQTQNTVPSATTSIVPGFTDTVTTVRPATTSTIDITSTGPNLFFNRFRRADVGAEHKWGPWQIEYNARYTQTHINIGQIPDGGVLINRITNVGWILDRTASDLFPTFTANGGADYTNPANYRPAAVNALTNANNKNLQEVTELNADVRYAPSLAIPIKFKTGFNRREQTIGASNDSRRWNYKGTGPLPADSSVVLMDRVKTGRQLPVWEASEFIRNRAPIDPSLWTEDLYFHESARFTGFTDATEKVTAAYAMAQGKLGNEGWRGHTGFLGGVRVEKTDNDAHGWVRARALSTVAQQLTDPVGAAASDYLANPRTTKGSYTKAFPSIHLWHDWTANLKTRVSWSTGFGRPPFSTLIPGETPNEANANFQGRPTLTINNPSLLPQTARNWDGSLEYYFEPVGNLSVSWFHKEIRDYIVSGQESGTIGTGNDNGYNGQYPGFTILTTTNAGTAFVQGWEISYQQQFTFLPGALKGLSGMINYTLLKTHGDFGGTSQLSGGQVAGFVPRTANASLSWRYRRFSTRVLMNYAGTYLSSYTAATPWRNLYRVKRNLVSLGFSYQVRPSANLTLDIDNLNNVPQQTFRGTPNQVQNYNYPGTTITAGINGRF